MAHPDSRPKSVDSPKNQPSSSPNSGLGSAGFFTTSRENLLAWAVLLAVVLASAIALWPELSISRVDLNDNVFHFTLIERMAQALEHGENPLDTWSPEWTLGYPVLRTYQPLAHLLVIGAWLVLGKSVSLMTVFVWARFFPSCCCR